MVVIKKKVLTLAINCVLDDRAIRVKQNTPPVTIDSYESCFASNTWLNMVVHNAHSQPHALKPEHLELSSTTNNLGYPYENAK